VSRNLKLYTHDENAAGVLDAGAAVTCLGVYKNGKRLVAAYNDSSIVLWDLQTMQILSRTVSESRVTSVRMCSLNRFVAVTETGVYAYKYTSSIFSDTLNSKLVYNSTSVLAVEPLVVKYRAFMARPALVAVCIMTDLIVFDVKHEHIVLRIPWKELVEIGPDVQNACVAWKAENDNASLGFSIGSFIGLVGTDGVYTGVAITTCKVVETPSTIVSLCWMESVYEIDLGSGRVLQGYASADLQFSVKSYTDYSFP
jgi:hypothetical protein